MPIGKFREFVSPHLLIGRKIHSKTYANKIIGVSNTPPTAFWKVNEAAGRTAVDSIHTIVSLELLDNLGFETAGAGGADIGENVVSDSDIFYLLKKGHDKIKGLKKKIMVTHMHHAGSKAEFSGFKGSKGIKEAIEKFQPDFAISAHIHEAGGLIEKIGKTTIINVARNAAIFEI